MHSSTWKTEEREVASAFGGKRRGPVQGNGRLRSGHNDVIGVPGLSIEVGMRTGGMGLSLMRQKLDEAVNAAEFSSEGMDVPIAVARLTGWPKDDRIVCLRLADFIALWERAQS